MDDSAAETFVDRRPWGEAAFAEARELDRPLVLSLAARWSAECRRMDEETYGEPRVAAAIDDGFVPVRVDADRRPRVRERYNAGGFPTTAFAAPDGRSSSRPTASPTRPPPRTR